MPHAMSSCSPLRAPTPLQLFAKSLQESAQEADSDATEEAGAGIRIRVCYRLNHNLTWHVSIERVSYEEHGLGKARPRQMKQILGAPCAPVLNVVTLLAL